MNVLVIGSGGREHAIAWKLAQSPKAARIFVAPGNAGTGNDEKLSNINIASDDFNGLVAFAKSNDIGLTIVGPEAPLVAGIVDAFQVAGLPCFGPSQRAAELEASKVFTKEFLDRHGIPTAAYHTVTDLESATNFLDEQHYPLVIKANGLAAGKGVIIAQDCDQAISTVEDMLSGQTFGTAGSQVVIEEFLQGEEVSFIVMVDGTHILPLASSQDHKARDDGDVGPNTGGMGAYSPAPIVTPELHDRIMKQVIEPTVRGMAEEGRPYTGFLYAGLMISTEGVPKVLEYNCRFGDPEAQPIMMRLDSDLVELCQAALEGRLAGVRTQWDPRPALGVVMAAAGYPGPYKKGEIIGGLENVNESECQVFHAGTAVSGGKITTNGGRVLCVCARGESISKAQRKAYACVKQIHWPGAYYRSDIGHRAIAREQKG